MNDDERHVETAQVLDHLFKFLKIDFKSLALGNRKVRFLGFVKNQADSPVTRLTGKFKIKKANFFIEIFETNWLFRLTQSVSSNELESCE